MKNYNYEAFKALRDTYKSITVEEIGKQNIYMFLRNKTGFVTQDMCTLCKATIESEKQEYNCKLCLWSLRYKFNGLSCVFSNYFEIHKAETPQELITALAERVKIMDEIIEKYLKADAGTK